MAETPSNITLNYGTAEDAAKGRSTSFDPPAESGDYKWRITGVRVAPIKKAPEVLMVRINCMAFEDSRSEKTSGFGELMFFNIPAGKEDEYQKYNPNRQKFIARSLLNALGINLAARDEQGKTTATLDPAQWKGLEFYGYGRVYEDKWDQENDDGTKTERKRMKCDVREVFTPAEFAERNGVGADEDKPLSDEIKADA